jgi:hypothetical protein
MKKAACVLCGRFGPVTREHVPPRALFLKPRPQNTITVPLCEPCNGASKLDDEYFRLHVTMGAEPGTKLGRLWAEKVVAKTLQNSPKLKSMLAEEREKFAELYKGRTVRTADGQLVPEEMHYLLQPLSAKRINGIVEKMVRCLHFHEHKERLPTDAGFVINTIFWTEDDYEMVKHFPTGGVGMEGEFLYHYRTVEPGAGRWLLSFYDKHVFDVIVSVPVA